MMTGTIVWVRAKHAVLTRFFYVTGETDLTVWGHLYHRHGYWEDETINLPKTLISDRPPQQINGRPAKKPESPPNWKIYGGPRLHISPIKPETSLQKIETRGRPQTRELDLETIESEMRDPVIRCRYFHRNLKGYSWRVSTDRLEHMGDRFVVELYHIFTRRMWVGVLSKDMIGTRMPYFEIKAERDGTPKIRRRNAHSHQYYKYGRYFSEVLNNQHDPFEVHLTTSDMRDIMVTLREVAEETHDLLQYRTLMEIVRKIEPVHQEALETINEQAIQPNVRNGRAADNQSPEVQEEGSAAAVCNHVEMERL